MYAQTEEDKIMDGYSAYKKTEKYFRGIKGKPIDYSLVIDFGAPDFDPVKEKIEVKKVGDHTLYMLDYPKGCFVVKKYFSIESQLKMAKKCLNEYIQKPYRTNLFIYEPGYVEKDGSIPKYDKNIYVLADYSKYYFDTKIRWANVGYHYDWNERYYPQTKTIIPDDFKKLATDAMKTFGLGYYEPESVIINYYGKKDYMSGHLDDGEPDQERPILSYTVGLACIFMIGGPTKDIQPKAIKLETGDLLVMSGFSRTCFHGVPKVIENSFDRKPFDKWVAENMPEVVKAHQEAGDNIKKPETEIKPNDEIHTINYLSENRLNFNFRQVFTHPEPEKKTQEMKVPPV